MYLIILHTILDSSLRTWNLLTDSLNPVTSEKQNEAAKTSLIN